MLETSVYLALEQLIKEMGETETAKHNVFRVVIVMHQTFLAVVCKYIYIYIFLIHLYECMLNI